MWLFSLSPSLVLYSFSVHVQTDYRGVNVHIFILFWRTLCRASTRQSDNFELGLNFFESSCFWENIHQLLTCPAAHSANLTVNVGTSRWHKVSIRVGKKRHRSDFDCGELCLLMDSLVWVSHKVLVHQHFHDMIPTPRFCRELSEKGKISSVVHLSGEKMPHCCKANYSSTATLFFKRYQLDVSNKMVNECT